MASLLEDGCASPLERRTVPSVRAVAAHLFKIEAHRAQEFRNVGLDGAQ